MKLNHKKVKSIQRMNFFFFNVYISICTLLKMKMTENDFDILTSISMVNFTILPNVRWYNKPLFAPVLQHLRDGVASDPSPLDGYAVLHGLLKRKFHIQTCIDAVVLAPLRSFSTGIAHIVATVKSVLDAVAEEVERILQE